MTNRRSESEAPGIAAIQDRNTRNPMLAVTWKLAVSRSDSANRNDEHYGKRNAEDSGHGGRNDPIVICCFDGESAAWQRVAGHSVK
jgi:hypothetical protein